MSLCINPKCSSRENPDQTGDCLACGTPLLIQERYQLITLIRPLDGPQGTEIFVCVDTLGEPSTHQIMKVMALSGDEKDSKRVEFMRRENKALRSIQHFAIPKVPRDGFFIIPTTQVAPEIHCLVMEKFEGETLEQWLSSHPPLTQDLALDWLEQLIHCLHEVHSHDFIHRDIKPENILLQPDESLALIDFGAVRDMTPTYMAKLHDSSNPNFEGTGIYTIGYAPPEQMDGKTLPQSDFYALGRTFVHLVTGIHPRQLPVDEQTGALVWREQAPQIDETLASFFRSVIGDCPGKATP